jgi:hypothetical protein
MLLEKFLEKVLGAEVANVIVEGLARTNCRCKADIVNYLGYLTLAEVAKRLKSARYVPVEEFKRMIGRQLFKKLLEVGAVPMIMCAGGKYAVIDFNAFVKFAEHVNILEEVAGEFTPKPDVVPVLEQLVRLGVAKKYKTLYVMPKTAMTLFRLPEEILENVFFVNDKIFISMPQAYSLRPTR